MVLKPKNDMMISGCDDAVDETGWRRRGEVEVEVEVEMEGQGRRGEGGRLKVAG